MSNEVHIVSLIIHCNPDYWQDVLHKAQQLPQAECHSNEENHKFIVVFEAQSEAELHSIIQQINAWPGVWSSQLCYHHCETAASLNEELNYATHTS